MGYNSSSNMFDRNYFPKICFLSFKLQMEGASFEMTFFGEGYSTGQDPQQGKPNVKICTQVKGPGRASLTKSNYAKICA